jgi:hypothetical protein
MSPLVQQPHLMIILSTYTAAVCCTCTFFITPSYTLPRLCNAAFEAYIHCGGRDEALSGDDEVLGLLAGESAWIVLHWRNREARQRRGAHRNLMTSELADVLVRILQQRKPIVAGTVHFREMRLAPSVEAVLVGFPERRRGAESKLEGHKRRPDRLRE